MDIGNELRWYVTNKVRKHINIEFLEINQIIVFKLYEYMDKT